MLGVKIEEQQMHEAFTSNHSQPQAQTPQKSRLSFYAITFFPPSQNKTP